jgi:hypothetical protein
MTVKVALSACEEKTTLPADKFHMDQIEQTLKDNVKIDIFHHFSHPRRETCCGLETPCFGEKQLFSSPMFNWLPLP